MVGEGHPYKYGKQVKEMNDSGKTMPLPLTSGKIIMFKHVEDRNSQCWLSLAENFKKLIWSYIVDLIE